MQGEKKKHPILKTLLIASGITSIGHVIYNLVTRGAVKDKGRPKASASDILRAAAEPPRRWHPHALVAHRGLHGDDVPENSLAAFDAAVAAGYCIELDCRLTGDGKLVVFHDAELERMCGVRGRLSERGYHEIAWLPLKGSNQNIPTLEAALRVIAGRVPVMVEIKCDGNNWKKATRAAMGVLDSYDGIFCVESFDYRCVKALRSNRPDWEIGLLLENLSQAEAAIELCSFPDYIACRWEDADQVKIEELYGQYDVPAVAWTVHSDAEMNVAADMGFSVFVFEGFRPAIQHVLGTGEDSGDGVTESAFVSSQSQQ